MQKDEYISGVSDMSERLKQILNQFDFWKYETNIISDGKTKVVTCNRDFIIDEIKREIIQQRIKKRTCRAKKGNPR